MKGFHSNLCLLSLHRLVPIPFTEKHPHSITLPPQGLSPGWFGVFRVMCSVTVQGREPCCGHVSVVSYYLFFRTLIEQSSERYLKLGKLFNNLNLLENFSPNLFDVLVCLHYAVCSLIFFNKPPRSLQTQPNLY